jgi:proline dehydrogenase
MLPPLAGRFVAGESEATALERARRLNDRNIGAILNLLGEHYHARPPADRDTDTYCQLIEDIADTGLRACISVKPSQLGLDAQRDLFRSNLERTVGTAAEHGVFVWIDMEDHTTTDATLDAFEALAREHDGGVGVCVQANLERTPTDLKLLAAVPGKVRLVKGAYDPPPDVGFTDRERVDEAYRSCLETMFTEFEDGIAVGSHDPAMIDAAERLHETHGTPYEIQMLMGVREDAQTELARDRNVWQYVPYGEKWLSYFYRRVRERKENALFAARALLS